MNIQSLKSRLEAAAQGTPIKPLNQGVILLGDLDDPDVLALGQEIAAELFVGVTVPPHGDDVEIRFPANLLVDGIPVLATVTRDGRIYLSRALAVLDDDDILVTSYSVEHKTLDITIKIHRKDADGAFPWLKSPAEALHGLPRDDYRLDLWTPTPGPAYDGTADSVIAIGLALSAPALSIVVPQAPDRDLVLRALGLLRDYLANHPEVPARHR